MWFVSTDVYVYRYICVYCPFALCVLLWSVRRVIGDGSAVFCVRGGRCVGCAGQPRLRPSLPSRPSAACHLTARGQQQPQARRPATVCTGQWTLSCIQSNNLRRHTHKSTIRTVKHKPNTILHTNKNNITFLSIQPIIEHNDKKKVT